MAKEDRIRFFGLNDGKTYTSFRKVVDFIHDFDSEKKDFTLSEIVEIYNVSKFWEILAEEEKVKFNKNFDTIAESRINCYFNMNQLSELDFEYKELNRLYQRDFWKMFLKYKVEKRTATTQLQAFISVNNIDVKNLMNQKSNCDAYNGIVKMLLLEEPRHVELLLEKYNSCSIVDYEFPNNFTDAEMDSWVTRYCGLSDAKEEYLIQIAKWSESYNQKFDKLTRANAIKALKRRGKVDGENDDGIQIAVLSIIKTTDFPVVNQNYEELLETLESILGFKDKPGYFPLVRWNSHQEMKETKLSYYENTSSIITKDYCTNQLRAFCTHLSSGDVEVEDILEFNYKELIKEKYSVGGFEFTPTTKGNNYYDKIKSLTSEMERILNYYSIYEEYGEADEDIFSVLSYSPDFRTLKSHSKEKFVYANSEDVIDFCNLLFHDETELSVLRDEFEPVSFYDYVKNGARFADLDDYKKSLISGNAYLNNLLGEDDLGQTFFKNMPLIDFYNTLWQYGYYSMFHLPVELLRLVDDEVQKGKLKYEGTLFSEQENNYISYMLDNKLFDNGPEIRNRGAHGTLPPNSFKKYEGYYLNLLIIFLLYTVRINEELDYQNKKRITEGDADYKH